MATALTKLDRVKAFLAETGTSLDTMIDELILSVSEGMERYMHRTIGQTAITGERVDGPGVEGRITLASYPIVSVEEVREGYASPTVLVEGTDFEQDAKVGQLIRLSDGAPTSWASGRRLIGVDYTAGFSQVPEDLAHAATLQVALQVKKSDARGGHLGHRSEGIGDWNAGFVLDAWLPEVLDTMKAYRDLRRF